MDSNIFLLRSVDRTSSSSSSHNFAIKLPREICGEYEVEYVQMYNNFYTIQAGLNDKIYWNDNSTNHTTTITPGIYATSGSNNIATEIGTQMTADTSAGATVTAAFDAISQKLTITSDQNFLLKFGTNTASSAAKTLGFTNADTSADTTATASYLSNLGGPTSVNIRIAESDITTWVNGQGQYGSILLPMNVSQGALKYYARDDFPQFIGFSRPVSQLNIVITDTSGNTISQNGSEWEMAIRRTRPRF